MKTKFEIWLDKLNKEREEYWNSKFTYKPYEPFTIKKGRKFMKLISDNSVWGFVCMYDGEFKGMPVKKGDLMKAASWSAPAKHARGNIFDGTATYSFWGPTYIK
jgi:hypothetical protein